MQRVCVFSGSNGGSRQDYTEAADSFGRELAVRGLGLVYGGAHVGLMGVLADAALEAGGEVIGVIPHHLKDKELAHSGLSELHLVEGMHERKALMSDLSGGFAALPGGFGTLEEFAEVLTWSQLGLQRKPCALLDVAGFYQPLMRFVDHAIAEGFIPAEHRDLMLLDKSPAALLDAMTVWQPPAVGKWLKTEPPGR